MVLTPEDTTTSAKLFSVEDTSDRGWYYDFTAIHAFPNEEGIGRGLVRSRQRHYIAFVSTASDQVDIYFQGALLGSTNAGFVAPPVQAIFFRDDSLTERSQQVDAVVEALRISNVTRTPDEIAAVQARVTPNVVVEFLK